MINNYEAILWDCDGVLIDSEKISCGAAVEFLNECGYEVTLPTFLTKFMGKGRKQIIEDILAETGMDLSAKYAGGRYTAFQNERFAKYLKSTQGIESLLERVEVPMAVASGSELSRLHFTLGLTNLLRYFDGHIYSAEMVAKGKPSPDIFLHAAEKLGVNPKKCLVIEDGIHGIHAAQAAGMDVWVYLGGEHIFEDLENTILSLGANGYFYDMKDIESALFKGMDKVA